MRYVADGVGFNSTKTNITHCVLARSGVIMAKCSSLELAQKAKAKDERLYSCKGLRIVEAVLVS